MSTVVLEAAPLAPRSAGAVQRDQLEAALVAGTAVPWRHTQLDDPEIGPWARLLIWEVSGDGGTWTAGWPERDGDRWRLVSATGAEVPVEDSSTVRIWHPVHADAGEVRAWRDFVAGRAVRQPFKQAYREV